MGYEEMAADGGYGRIGTPENRAMADHLEEVDQREMEMMEDQEPDPGDVWADLQCRAETAEAERDELRAQLEAGRTKCEKYMSLWGKTQGRLDCSVKNLKSMENKMNDLREQLEAVREAVDPENGCECVHHACDDMPCDWCFKMSDRVLAILQPDSGKDGG